MGIQISVAEHYKQQKSVRFVEGQMLVIFTANNTSQKISHFIQSNKLMENQKNEAKQSTKKV